MTPIYFIILGVLILALAGLVFYARKSAKDRLQQGQGDGPVKTTGPTIGRQSRLNPEELVALPTENLIDVIGVEGDFLLTRGGDIVAMLHIAPVLITTGTGPEGLDHNFAKAIHSLPDNVNIQVVSMPMPTEIHRLTEGYALQAHVWRKKHFEASKNNDPDLADLYQTRYWITGQIGSMILDKASGASHRASLLVLTQSVGMPGDNTAEITEDILQKFSHKVSRISTTFASNGINIKHLPPEIALHFLWYAYNPDSGPQVILEQSAERFAELAFEGEASTATVSALTEDHLALALERNDLIPRILAPAVAEEKEQEVDFNRKTMLLWYIPDFRTQLPTINRLTGQGSQYSNKLYVSYYINAPNPGMLAFQTRKASTSAQAMINVAEKAGMMPSYAAQEKVVAIEEARWGAETEKDIPRMLGLYVGLLVDSEKTKSEAASFEAIMDAAGMVYVPARWTALNVWKTMIPLGQRHHTFEDRNVFSDNTSRLNPVAARSLFDPAGEFLGFTASSATDILPVAVRRKRGTKIVPGDALIGAPGSGKSFTLKHWICDWIARGHRVMVVDPKSEMGPVTKLLKGSMVDALGTKGFNLLRFDNFPVNKNSELGRALTKIIFSDNLEAIEALYRTVKGDDAKIAGTEINYFTRALIRAMELKGMDREDPETWEPNKIFLSDVFDVLAREMIQEDPQTIGLMTGTLEQYATPAGLDYATYNTPTDLDLDNDLVTITFGVSQFSTDTRQKTLSYHFALRMAAQYAIRKFLFSGDETPQPFHIVIDEASQILTNASLVASVVRMISLLPAYGISVHLAFQDMKALERIEQWELGQGVDSTNTLLGTIPAFWMFGQERTSAAKAADLLNLQPFEASMIHGLDVGHCLLIFPRAGIRIPIMIQSPDEFHPLFRTDPAAMKAMIDAAMSDSR